MNRLTETISSWEDPLTYLSRKPTQEFARGRVIYGPDRPADRLFLLVSGRVKINTTRADGYETIGRLISPEGLFGEAVLIGGRPTESAITLEAATVMSWTRDEIEHLTEREPRLGLALSQYLVRQCISLQERIESMAVHKTPERVMIALIQLADQTGTVQPDGATRVPSLTHRTIAEYIGTSREIVTYQMNRLRRLGLIRYTRRYIEVMSPTMIQALREQGVQIPWRVAAMRQAGV
jgi:CRP/FNR family transcriptional regulator, cyclic AMP receptor protein